MATPVQYVQSNTFFLAGSGVIQGVTTAALTNFSDIYGNVLTMASFGVKGYGTAEPDTSNEEGFTFTSVTANANGTYTLGGISSILAQSPYTESSGFVRNHAGGQEIVITDNVAFWNTFANKSNDETITGQWTFSTFPITPTNSQATDTVAGVATLKVHNYATDTGTANAYVIAPSPAITAYTTGAIFTFKATNANTGASTVNISGLGVKTIKKNVSIDLANNDILASQIVAIEYDGTNFQLVSNPSTLVTDTVPNVRVITAQNVLGSTSTQFTVTNPSGTTFTYTYTGTGTNPGTLNTLMPVGSTFSIQSTSLSAANTGLFTVTASTGTSFSVTNASGVAESTKTLANGYLDIGTTYTPTVGVKYIELEIVGGGAQGPQAGSTNASGVPGAAGGYLKKLLSSGFSGLQAIVGPATTTSTRSPSGLSAFGPALIASGASGVTPGSASGGDISITGNAPGSTVNISGGSVGAMPGAAGPFGGAGLAGQSTNSLGGNGMGYGSGGGAAASGSAASASGNGFQGVIILTEHFI